MSKVNKTDTCWLWVRAKDKYGYGLVRQGNRTLGAHRVAYSLFKGELIEGMQIDHLCKVRECVNPDHLEQVTHQENLNRSTKHGNPNGHLNFKHSERVRTHCPNGHEYTVDNIVKQRSTKKTYKCVTCRKARKQRAYQKTRQTPWLALGIRHDQHKHLEYGIWVRHKE